MDTRHMSAEELRALAADSRKRSAESFERCDTDGFLSQWSSNIMADLYDTQALIKEQGGEADILTLWYTPPGREGRMVIAKNIGTRFGSCWLLHPDERKIFGRTFIPVGSDSRIQRKLGLSEFLYRRPAWARLEGKGHGLSGSVWIQVYPLDIPSWKEEA